MLLMGCLLTTVVEDLNYKGASPSNRAVDINPEDIESVVV
jgi:hypothetical protein